GDRSQGAEPQLVVHSQGGHHGIVLRERLPAMVFLHLRPGVDDGLRQPALRRAVIEAAIAVRIDDAANRTRVSPACRTSHYFIETLQALAAVAAEQNLQVSVELVAGVI